MKILFMLLACMATAQAASYSYSYYCQRNFEVYPCMSSYKYCIYFNNAWCSYGYYAPIVKVYPEANCGKAGWTEKSVADVKAELQNMLKDSLIKMFQEIYTRREKWLAEIDARHAEFLERMREYMEKYYNFQSFCVGFTAVQRDQKIADYEKKLNEMRAEALAKYNAAITAKIQSVLDFHVKVVENAVKCLETRVTKIAEYTKVLDERIRAYIAKFAKFHFAVLKQKTDYYKLILSKVHCSATWEVEKVDACVAAYRARELPKVYAMIQAYAAKLQTYRTSLLAYYTCAFRCFMFNGCANFASRSYYGYCAKLGQWWCFKSSYKCGVYRCGGFRYNWRGCNYKLKTCDISKLDLNLDAMIDELNKKLEEAISKRTTLFVTRKLQWIDYFNKYVEKYTEIVRERHVFYQDYVKSMFQIKNQSMDLTPDQLAEINKMKAECDDLVAKIVAEYRTQIFTQIDECVTKFEADIAAYREKFATFVASIRAKYAECTTKRTTAIAAYRKKLIAMRDAQRTKLYDGMWKAKVAHWNGYLDLLRAFHGENFDDASRAMYRAYATKLVTYCDVVMDKFDAHWADLLEKMVLSYTCSYRCSVAVRCIPSYSCANYFRWSVRFPTQCTYTTYYTIYQRYCGFKVCQYGCRYVYVK